MTLTPMGDGLLIRPSHPEQVTSGGIIIPDSATEKPVQGRVLVVGEGRLTDDGQVIKPRVSVDDEVLYARNFYEWGNSFDFKRIRYSCNFA